jgi:hypothetical protein
VVPFRCPRKLWYTPDLPWRLVEWMVKTTSSLEHVLRPRIEDFVLDVYSNEREVKG